MSLSSKKLGLSALGVFVLALAVVQGCSSSDDSSQAQPTAGTNSGGTKANGGSGGASTGGTKANGGSSAGGTTTQGGSGGQAGSGTPDEGGAGGEGGAVDCNGPDGCYNCAPKTDTQFLNHCVAGGCQPAQDFHLPATLPALP